jgi:hypothetical protein
MCAGPKELGTFVVAATGILSSPRGDGAPFGSCVSVDGSFQRRNPAAIDVSLCT